MKWYSSAAKRIGNGIVLFLFPTMVLFFIFEKAISIAQSIILNARKPGSLRAAKDLSKHLFLKPSS